jgi:acetyltransferase-like isoleucine patch superfamily enzyme
MHSSDRRFHTSQQDPLWVFPRILNKLYTMWLGATYPFASWGHKSSFHYTAEIWRNRAHRIKIGNYVQVGKDVRLSASVPPGEKGDPTIILDDNSCLLARVHISAKNLIHIERDVIVSASALIMDHSHAYEDVGLPIAAQGITSGGRIRIGQGCWIGQGAAIVCSRGELVLGRNCVVGANSVVTRSFPEYSVILGIPGRVVKQYDPVKGVWILGSGTPSITGPDANSALAGESSCRGE